MIHRTGTVSALLSASGLFFGLWIAALATMIGSPLAALAAGLVGLLSLVSILSAPSVEITEVTAPVLIPEVVFRAGSSPPRAATRADLVRWTQARRTGGTYYAPVTGRGGAWLPAVVCGLPV